MRGVLEEEDEVIVQAEQQITLLTGMMASFQDRLGQMEQVMSTMPP